MGQLCTPVTLYILFPISVMGYLTLVHLFSNESCGRNNSYDGLSIRQLERDTNKRIISDNEDELRGKLKFSNRINVVSSVFKTNAARQSRILSSDTNVYGGPVINNRVLNSEIRTYDDGGKKVPFKYLFDCSNIHLIRIRKKVGEGVSKDTYLGEYNDRQVAVKMVSRHQADVKRCLWKYQENLSGGTKASISQKDKDDCYIFPTMKLMKETLILQQLNHPGIVKLIGFCVRNEESETSDLSKHGVIVIEEYGSRFMLSALQLLPWQKRLELARELASLLLYLHQSPLGSLIVPDFKEEHFLMNNGTIKLTDFDDVSNVEPVCVANVESRDVSPLVTRSRSVCDFNISCQLGVCVGTNAKRNLQNMRDLFFKRLILSGSFPAEISDDLTDINIKLDNLSIDADGLYCRLSQLLLSLHAKSNR